MEEVKHSGSDQHQGIPAPSLPSAPWWIEGRGWGVIATLQRDQSGNIFKCWHFRVLSMFDDSISPDKTNTNQYTLYRDLDDKFLLFVPYIYVHGNLN